MSIDEAPRAIELKRRPEPDRWDYSPSEARIHNHFLGGALNSPLDRLHAEHVIATDPIAPFRARAHRAFLAHAVTDMLDHGIRQLIDLGSGLPTCNATHQVVEQQRSDVRVLYVDNDPGTVAASQAILNDHHTATAVSADLCDPAAVLHHATAAGLDLYQPIGVLAIDVVHTIPQLNDPSSILAAYTAALAPASRLALTIRATTATPSTTTETRVPSPVDSRQRAALVAWLAGLRLIGPGISTLHQWLGPELATGVEQDLAVIAQRTSPTPKSNQPPIRQQPRSAPGRGERLEH